MPRPNLDSRFTRLNRISVRGSLPDDPSRKLRTVIANVQVGDNMDRIGKHYAVYRDPCSE